MRVKGIWLVFSWYNLWVGFYWNRATRKLYIQPVPTTGVCIEFGEAED